VYGDLRVIEATWRVLVGEGPSPWCIPKDNRTLVERGTHPERLRAIVEKGGERWQAHAEHLLGKHFADRSLPTIVGLDRSRPFAEDPFAPDLDRIKTRLGQDDYRVPLPSPQRGPFGLMVDELNVSEHLLDDMPQQDETGRVTEALDGGGFTFTFAGTAFRYTRLGLERGHEV
jgi:CRISPR-associated endonuclease/helicase Cas3